ncbi:hypothetical protein AMTR_s00016p00254530 [Amborella trichopoda]|uniref:Uncharacterized protein n=3 Tax=Amborella trichopoda TaxID=13333 RepID=W1PFJ0_AMBTC|nr:hypothetical protein AMTR_s00016p00254530 [Amborella trichopoda]
MDVGFDEWEGHHKQRGKGRGMETTLHLQSPMLPERASSLTKPSFPGLGPFHHGSPHLQPMEQHKRRQLLHFLNRSKHPSQVYLDALQAKEQAIRDCYEWPGDLAPPESTEFINMTLLDGCFLLELHRISRTDGETGYTAEDPVFGSKSALFFVHHHNYRDLMMLENRIPLMVLNTPLDPLGTGICTRVNEVVLELLGEEIQG